MIGQKPLILSVKVVIRDPDGRCLLLKRADSSRGNPGKWELPGGKAALQEEFEQVVQREVSEETALTISLQRALGTVQADLPMRKVIYLVLEADLVSGQVQLSSEHQEYAWRYPHELPEMDLVRHFIPFARKYAQGEL